VLDAMTHAAAHVTNARLDILASNSLNSALYWDLLGSRDLPVNAPRFVFLDPRAHEFYVDWEHTARDVVAALRSAAGRNPHDRDLSDLVGELSVHSDEFRSFWAMHNVRFHVTGVKDFRHPIVGEITLSYERMELSADSGLAIMTYTAEPGSKSERRSSCSRAGGRPRHSPTRQLRPGKPEARATVRPTHDEATNCSTPSRRSWSRWGLARAQVRSPRRAGVSAGRAVR